MKRRWIANINSLMRRLANPYRPERHYMRGGKSRDMTAGVEPGRDKTVPRGPHPDEARPENR